MLLQILVRGGHNTKCRLQRRCAAHTEKPTGFQGAEQLGLGLHIKIAHLIQHEGAAARLLELTRGDTAVFFCAEKFECDTFRRQRTQIDFDQWPRR